MGIDFYPKKIQALSPTNLWVTDPGSVRNIDLRVNLHNLLFGDRAHPGQGKLVVVRHMNTVCPCVLEERGQKQREPDPLCSVCQGEGYTFTDKLYTAWRSTFDSHSGAIIGSFKEEMPGLINLVGDKFIFEWNVPVQDIDKVIEVGLMLKGGLPPGGLKKDDKMSNQYKKFKISQRLLYRGDRSRVEYIGCACEQEQW